MANQHPLSMSLVDGVMDQSMQRNKRWKALFDKWLQRSIIQKEFEKRFKLILEISKPIFGQLSWEFDEFENLTFRCIITSFLESYFDDLFQSNCICKWSTLIQIENWNGRYCVYMPLNWPFSKINKSFMRTRVSGEKCQKILS